ncbi:MAG: dienelactone hydrolase family protein [Polyangiaceae bacterium]
MLRHDDRRHAHSPHLRDLRAPSGFALAIAARARGCSIVHTDETGLATETVQLKTTNGPLPACVASPAGKGPSPSSSSCRRSSACTSTFRDVCRRFAKLGAMAIAPELYARYADVSKMSDIQEILRTVVSKVPDAQVLSDLDAAVQWAEESGRAAKDKLGVTGFCWGGRITWLYSAHNPKVKAGVAWYGRLTSDVTANQPKHPVDVAKDIKAPVLGLYGGKDTGIPLDTVEKMRAALKTPSPRARSWSSPRPGTRSSPTTGRAT